MDRFFRIRCGSAHGDGQQKGRDEANKYDEETSSDKCNKCIIHFLVCVYSYIQYVRGQMANLMPTKRIADVLNRYYAINFHYYQETAQPIPRSNRF